MATDATTATSLRDQIDTFVRHTQLCFQGYQLFQIGGEALRRQHHWSLLVGIWQPVSKRATTILPRSCCLSTSSAPLVELAWRHRFGRT